MDPAGVEPASRETSSKNVYMRMPCSRTRPDQPNLFGGKWATTILPFLSGPDQPIIGVNLIGR